MTTTPTDGPNLTLGINTCFAVKRWPQPQDWAHIVVEELGLSSVQLSLDLVPFGLSKDAIMRYADRARTAAEKFGINIHSVFTGLAAYSSSLLLSEDPSDRAAAFEWYQEMIAFTAAVGATGLGGHIGALSVPAAADPTLAKTLIATELDLMRELAETAADAGLDHLQFENLAVAREYGHSIDEAHAIETELAGTAVPWRLCLDVGHPSSLTQGTPSSDPQAWLTEKWLNTPVVQLQQSPVGADHHGPFTAAANAAGTVDRDAVLAELSGWDGDVHLFFEIIHSNEYPDSTVLAELRESVQFWRDGLDHSTTR
ncbi:sugar phosphate isomerase/epimerase family protein [Mycolicibacterium peregrinum]|uniref:Sugar phosphate isomerase/epimerase n=1 Tax=Mycolicibacterium peregrinum TaxID=43304 RepID=A0A4Z0HQF1_MYCPR|nr:TIM barrel protein [Mycolicibacterium peregrinum]TGB43216.1 sugar phosphate isomerase/epimerase [Mycolicibacterium peregrinum]TGB44013.1 sugar phosphate isomerase/epimerase [Mycolicibacterium peregrinum]